MANRAQSTRAVRTERTEARDPPPSNRPKAGRRDGDDIEDLEAGLAIDEHALEEALVSQPDFFYRVSKTLALEISRRDAAKQELTEAEFAAELRVRDAAADEAEAADAAKKPKKMTEGEVTARAQLDPEVKEARQRLAQLSESVGKLSSLKEAFSQRSYAIKDLVNLYIANYYTASEHQSATGIMKDRMSSDARASMNEERKRRGM